MTKKLNVLLLIVSLWGAQIWTQPSETNFVIVNNTPAHLSLRVVSNADQSVEIGFELENAGDVAFFDKPSDAKWTLQLFRNGEIVNTRSLNGINYGFFAITSNDSGGFILNGPHQNARNAYYFVNASDIATRFHFDFTSAFCSVPINGVPVGSFDFRSYDIPNNPRDRKQCITDIIYAQFRLEGRERQTNRITPKNAGGNITRGVVVFYKNSNNGVLIKGPYKLKP